MTESNQELYDQYLAGDEKALTQLLNQEYPVLFDYLFRMTGDKVRSADAADEVTQAVIAQAEKYQGLDAIRSSIYSTARSFNADAWNADTSQLLNEGLSHTNETSSSEENSDLAGFHWIDEGIRTLPGPQREVLLLLFKGRFSPHHAAVITGWGEERVMTLCQEGLDQIGQIAGIKDGIAERIKDLPLHPIPVRTSSNTMPISEVIENVRRSRPAVVTYLLNFVVVLIILGLAGVLLHWCNPTVFGK